MKTGSVMDFLIVLIAVMKPTAMVRNNYKGNRLITMNYPFKYGCHILHMLHWISAKLESQMQYEMLDLFPRG